MPDPAVLVSVAEAVKDQLEAATLSQTITPVRSYGDWEKPLEENDAIPEDTLFVDVVPVSTEQTANGASRSKLLYNVPVDIAVRLKFGVAEQDAETGRVEVEEVDAMVLLVQEIHEHFTLKRMTEFTAATWQETKIVVNPLIEHLRTFHQFTGVVRVTFAAYRTV